MTFAEVPLIGKRGLSSRGRFRCRLRADRRLAVLDPAVDPYMEIVSHHTDPEQEKAKDYGVLELRDTQYKV